MTAAACPVCAMAGSAVPRSQAIFLCANCGHWFSTLEPCVNEETSEAIAADIEVKEAVAPIRRAVYVRTLDLLAAYRPLSGLRHLDVGCSIGQFIALSSEKGLIASGVEPETAFASIAREKGLQVHEGYFPDALPSEERYDLISFMDVLGHIPAASQVIGESLRRLSDEGVVMIKTPSSNGTLFQLGRLARFIGGAAFWDRLWQVDFASPQIHYFSNRSMNAFARGVGAEIIARESYPALKLEGMWQRLLPGKAMNVWKAAILYGALLVIVPLLSVLPKDSMCVGLKPKK